LLSGLFGVGGGILMVPLLILLAGQDQRRASATSLLAIIPTAAVGAATYGARGELALSAGLIIAAGGMAGSWCGARALRLIPLAALRWAFVGLLAATAAWMAWYVPIRGARVALTPGVAVGMVSLGLVIGLAASLFGIGGGIIAVPALMALFGAGDLVARGTSLLIMIPTAVIGTATNIRGGLADVRGGLVAGGCAAAASWLGSALAFLLDPRAGNLLFAALVAAAAAQLAIKAGRRPRGPGRASAR
jgi:uncharacterized membrane protein YfcA